MSTEVQQAARATDAVVERLLARMAEKGDFPALSRSVKHVISVLRESEDQAQSRLVNIVLSDFALTQRVLRLANSAMYASFGGNITTVSHAVMLLGHDAVAHLALGLKLLDGLGAGAEYTHAAQDELSRALLASCVARQVTAGTKAHDTESAVICTLMSNLGQLLVSFYLPEDWSAILARAAAENCAEEAAAEAELGTSLAAIGAEVAQRWSLPATIREAMGQVDREDPRRPLEHVSWLATVARFSTTAARLVGRPDAGQRLTELARTYAPALGQDPALLSRAVHTAVAEAPEAERLRGRAAPTPGSGKPLDSLTRLRAGLNELERVPGTAQELLTMAAELMFRSLGFSRVVAFVHHRARRAMRARLVFGDGADELTDKLQFDEAFAPDVFHLVLMQNVPVFIENAADERIAQRLPRWYKERFQNVRSFLLLPVAVNNRPVALLYGEWSTALAPFNVTKDELSALARMRTALVERLQRIAQPGTLAGSQAML